MTTTKDTTKNDPTESLPLLSGPLGTDGENETRCDECGRRITIGPDGTEYGHLNGAKQRCSRRPESVDPADSTGGPTDEH